jgi:hypothetical protein
MNIESEYEELSNPQAPPPSPVALGAVYGKTAIDAKDVCVGGEGSWRTCAMRYDDDDDFYLLRDDVVYWYLIQ